MEIVREKYGNSRSVYVTILGVDPLENEGYKQADRREQFGEPNQRGSGRQMKQLAAAPVSGVVLVEKHNRLTATRGSLDNHHFGLFCWLLEQFHLVLVRFCIVKNKEPESVKSIYIKIETYDKALDIKRTYKKFEPINPLKIDLFG